MLREFVRTYTAQLERLKYSGILKWAKDGLSFQYEGALHFLGSVLGTRGVQFVKPV